MDEATTISENSCHISCNWAFEQISRFFRAIRVQESLKSILIRSVFSHTSHDLCFNTNTINQCFYIRKTQNVAFGRIGHHGGRDPANGSICHGELGWSYGLPHERRYFAPVLFKVRWTISRIKFAWFIVTAQFAQHKHICVRTRKCSTTSIIITVIELCSFSTGRCDECNNNPNTKTAEVFSRSKRPVYCDHSREEREITPCVVFKIHQWNVQFNRSNQKQSR